MEEEKVLTSVEKEQVVVDTADTAAAQEEPQGTGSIEVADASIGEAPAGAEDGISVETEAPAVPTVPPRPHKPHRQARPCPNWQTHYPGSPKLKEGEKPCQGWIVKPGNRQCLNCHDEERYGEESKPFVSESTAEGALAAALGVKGDKPDEWRQRGVFQRAVSEYRGSDDPSLKEAREIATESVRLFEDGEFRASFERIQSSVERFLAGLREWCYKESFRFFSKPSTQEERKLSSELETIYKRSQKAWQDEQDRTAASSRYPRWGFLEGAITEMQSFFVRFVRPRRQEERRKKTTKRFGVRLIL